MDPFLRLSPFEIKNILNSLAQEAHQKALSRGKKSSVFDVGRGNPNFFHTTVREAFDLWSLFASSLGISLKEHGSLALRPSIKGVARKFHSFCQKKPKSRGKEFLKKAFAYAIEKFSFSEEEFLFEMVGASLGDNYPTPPRILPHVEKIVKGYLDKVLCFEEKARKEKYLLFATEGATAGMIYLFNSLKLNFLLREGDEIAIVTPIFSPYLEIPLLQEFQLREIFVETTQSNEWQIPEKEIEKLQDPKIKALFLVDPTNPTAVALTGQSLDRLVALVRQKRRDLIVLTDTVYAPFVNHFRSLVDEIPENTICVYSYSKYFGATGWRLGVIMMHEKNVMDHLIQSLPLESKKKLQERYQTVTVDADHFPFMDRVVADSREEALAHTGGLSTPQQCIMALFSLFDLMDEKNEYKKAIQKILKRRLALLYKNLGMPLPKEEGNTFYYTLLDLLEMARKKYGASFGSYLEKKKVLTFFFDLAEKKETICLPGVGFGASLWTIRISLANCEDRVYAKVGKNIQELLESYYLAWKEIAS